MNIKISARARDDLDYIYASIRARRSPEAADEFLELAKAAVQFIAQHPMAGPHPKWATRHKTLRFWVIRRTNYLIYYFPEPEGVSVERVLDGRRNVARIIQQRIENPPEWE